jgi:hypothetical protein
MNLKQGMMETLEMLMTAVLTEGCESAEYILGLGTVLPEDDTEYEIFVQFRKAKGSKSIKSKSSKKKAKK